MSVTSLHLASHSFRRFPACATAAALSSLSSVAFDRSSSTSPPHPVSMLKSPLPVNLRDSDRFSHHSLTAYAPATTSSAPSPTRGHSDRSTSLTLLYQATSAGSPGDDPDQESTPYEGSQHQRIILVNPFTQGMVVIDGASTLDALLRGLRGGKGGRPPTSRESIEALPSVEVEEGCGDLECVVCLEEFGVGVWRRRCCCSTMAEEALSGRHREKS
ncbi:hypothetical protein Fmac_011703 [Flemingia macrophylla]|uniref:Uncharacterized protein n=1 Tax=Flemingia macrophylla TaxID=520843 RepID=A0ABD1MN77_9FABA